MFWLHKRVEQKQSRSRSNLSPKHQTSQISHKKDQIWINTSEVATLICDEADNQPVTTLIKASFAMLQNPFWCKQRDKIITVMFWFEYTSVAKKFFLVSWVFVRHSVMCSHLLAAPRNLFSARQIFFPSAQVFHAHGTAGLKAFISFFNSHKQVRIISEMLGIQVAIRRRIVNIFSQSL